MRRSDYYEQMKALAREKRSDYGLTTPAVGLRDMRNIYKDLGIKVDYWNHPLKTLRGAYFSDHNGKSVLISKSLPNDPKVFTLAHELKHHWVDQEQSIECSQGNQSEMIEIGAEVFAAEFLFPELDFLKR